MITRLNVEIFSYRRGESFIGCDYQSAFDKLSKPKCRNPSAQSNCSQKSCCDKNKPSKDNRKPSTNVSFKRDSASSNQCSQNKCGQGSEEVYLNPAETDDAKRLSKQWSKTMDEMRRVSQCMVIEPPCEKTPKCPKKKKSCQDDHIHCVTEDNYPCCNDDSSPFTSDDEEEDAKPKKKGFLCCAKNAEPSSTNVPKMRRADSFCPPNVKKIQTTEEDFKAAQVFYKQALEVEKKRQKLYSRQKVQMSSRCANMRNEFDKLSPKEREKLNIEYKKAKKMYRQRRRMMEEKATKSLEKEIKMVKAVKN